MRGGLESFVARLRAQLRTATAAATMASTRGAVREEAIPGRGQGLVAARDIAAGESVVIECALLTGRGLHLSTSQLNSSRVCHKTTPNTPLTPPSTSLTQATQPLRAPPIPYKALKLS